MLLQINGGVTAPRGFRAGGFCAGIKPGNQKPDMAMLVSDVPAISAGVYTKNLVKAAPVKWSSFLTTQYETAQVIVANSGSANACTGDEGYENAAKMAEKAAQCFGLRVEMALVASTGVIGKQLPMDVVLPGIEALSKNLSADEAAGTLAATAIMTTDTEKKEIAVEFDLDGVRVRIGGMCKGSGMIHPNMGTMLGFITTDAAISKEMLQRALASDVEDTFNMISVDGDTSTNDTVFMLANGMAGNRRITDESADYTVFCAALRHVTSYLAKRIAEDGEGATKLLEVMVQNAAEKADAVLLAKSVACSSLVKAAMYGNDANWGRVMCALGYAGVSFDPSLTDILFKSSEGSVQVVQNGVATEYDEEVATSILSAPRVSMQIDIKSGNKSATAWGCDLTYDYVKINADYRS